MGWSAPHVGRNDNYAKSDNAHVLCGRPAGSCTISQRLSRVRPVVLLPVHCHGAGSLRRSSRWRETGYAETPRRRPCQQVAPQVTCQSCGFVTRPLLVSFWCLAGCCLVAAALPGWRLAGPDPGWLGLALNWLGLALAAHTEHNHKTRSSSRGEAHASRAIRDSEAMVRALRSRSHRPVALSVHKSLSTCRGPEHAPRCPRSQPRQVRQRACAPWAVGRFSTGRSTRALRATELEGRGQCVSEPQSPTWRGVGEEKPRPTAWA